MKILLVDDTATIRTLMTTMLKRFDHQVTTAKDDVKAWRLLQRHKGYCSPTGICRA